MVSNSDWSMEELEKKFNDGTPNSKLLKKIIINDKDVYNLIAKIIKIKGRTESFIFRDGSDINLILNYDDIFLTQIFLYDDFYLLEHIDLNDYPDMFEIEFYQNYINKKDQSFMFATPDDHNQSKCEVINTFLKNLKKSRSNPVKIHLDDFDAFVYNIFNSTKGFYYSLKYLKHIFNYINKKEAYFDILESKILVVGTLDQNPAVTFAVAPHLI